MPGILTQPVDDLAIALRGVNITLPDGRMCQPTETEAFPRRDNGKGIYKPMLEMRPGDVYVARRQNSFLFLVVSHDTDGNGACVLVRSAVIGGEMHDGPGRVGSGVGFTAHQQTGRLIEQPDGSLVLEMTGVLEPRKPEKKSPKLTERALQGRMTDISEAYQRHADAAATLDDYLARIRAECKTVADLDAFLAQSD